MIVNRRTFNVKLGAEDDAVEHLLSGKEHPKIRALRAYRPLVSPFSTVCMEIEFDSMADYEEVWAAWRADPDTAAFMERWYELTLPGGTNEIWEVRTRR